MTSLTKIIGVTVNNNGTLALPSALFFFFRSELRPEKTYSHDALGPNQLDLIVHDASLSSPLTICLKVSQITNVSFTVIWCTMVLVKRIEMRSGGGTSISVVPKLVDVHSTLSVGVVSGNLVGDGCRGRLVFLREGDSSTHSGVSTDDGD